MTAPVLSPLMLRSERPSRLAGVLVAIASVAAATAVIYPLKQVTPVLSLGVVYVLAVLAVSTVWGLGFGIATSVLSAAAFNFFHLPPGGRFALADEREWVALLAFVVVAIATGLLAELARVRSREAEQRRQEADLASEMAQLLLGTAELEGALEVAAQRLAAAAGVNSAEISLDPLDDADDGALLFSLQSAQRQIGTLLLEGTLSGTERVRIADRVVPSLESILAAALHRAELQAEVVETAALRRSDELKTAVLRSVSHDLRTPLTAILMAATALDPERPTSENVADVREQVIDAATRLWRLVEKLLDLSLLQAGHAEPRLVWYSIDEVLQEAVEQLSAEPTSFKLSVEPGMPLLYGDPGQLERAFANVLENASRYACEKSVSVRARTVRDRIRVLVVDQGPGIPRGEQERIFLPFYRTPGASPQHSGSGLGLAITRGFLELNGGRISVESQRGQGTTFVVEFPLVEQQAEPLAHAIPGGPDARAPGA
ncbi:MAG: two-component system, OmpR family, sensor histidine kinase KdpD [Solirubrobacteraceae bacterium]|jgi:two-component system sensor histidine kinase KdpD|nr:two-component system, OmpR family, sensor histidine kinase KdpD [Solirubrobacteraceae bacterium]